ncbi:MAG: primosomal protein N' [Chitinispirillaceae bacterium]|nr:primosomal protein N' [Chitinispirillaceae bacterium]
MGQDNSGTAGQYDRIAAVAFPIALSGLYDYRIPPSLERRVVPGMPVLVDLRGRTIWGVAVRLKNSSSHAALKEIVGVRSEHWTDANKSLIRLYEWLAEYYQCDLGRVFRPLCAKGISRSRELTVTVYEAVSEPRTADTLTATQEAAWCRMKNDGGVLSATEWLARQSVKPHMIRALHKKGYLLRERKAVVRKAYELGFEAPRERIELTADQRRAVDAVTARFDAPDRPFLLHGITGSGKTHVYTELAAKMLAAGKTVIILVPEISLTPQTIRRFRSAVGDLVAVIHSHMSDGERRDALQELVTGAKRLVIGVRSAILAPMDKVGLIIVDEEHDSSYKQTDTDPRYHARDVAIMRGHFQKAIVLLGSATPSLESFHNARQGKYHLLTLTARFGPACLPTVQIADMNEERRSNNWTILSRPLEENIKKALAAGRQIILLLNRRGYSVTLLCKECGYSHQCPNCSVTLRYHLNDATLKCHLCGHDQAAPDTCPVCRGDQMKYQGTGIQKAEEHIRRLFPHARILRMDHDTTRRKGAHHDLLDAFAQREADILLGTQMVAKGLNFPGVSLVGVLQADTGLLFPDFRASERTFQLLAQVAGRAGRSDNAGEVVIQTCYPDDPAIRFAARHDYEGFSREEMNHRRSLCYPPFARLARIIVEGPHEVMARREMERLADTIRNESSDIIVLGPAPASLYRVNTIFRHSLLLKSSSSKRLGMLLSRVREREKKLPEKTRLIIDVDPVQML